MKTKNTITVQINDGRSILHSWSEDFEKLPTVGDTLKIDTSVSPNLKGYKDEAKVLLIEDNTSGNGQKLVLGAEPVSGATKRPTIIMNRDYVPKRHHREAESFLRKHFATPAFEWIESDLPQPIINVHADQKPSVQKLREITDELRDLLLKDAPVSVAR